MEDAFESGTVLSIWYDFYMVFLAFLVVLGLSVRAARWTPWKGRVPWAYKLVTLLGAVLVLLVVLDRFGVMDLSFNPDLMGNLSLIGGGIAAILGILAPTASRWMKPSEKSKDEPEEESEAVGETLTGPTMVLNAVVVPHAWLVVRRGGTPGDILEVKGESTAIGRSDEDDITLDDDSVSSSHALIRMNENQYVLYDMASSNGTWVNGQPVSGRFLGDGARITLGSSELHFTGIEAAEGQQATGGILLIRSGPSAGQSFTVQGEDIIIGRQPGEGGAQLNDQAVSSRHALIRPTFGGCMIFDLGSANGTMVDGEPVAGTHLQNGDTVKLGEAEVQFVIEESPSQRPPGAVPST